MRCSSPALVALASGLALAPRVAESAACCVGATATVPTRLGECEHWTVGLGLTGESATGRWDANGQVASTSLQDDALTTTLAGAWRWSRRWQVGAQLPVLASHKAAGDLESWGAGPGDARATVLWDPLEERPPGVSLVPTPLLTAGLRLPTGRSWEQSEDPLLADVTGRGEPAVVLGLAAERTLGRTPWSLGLDSEIEPAGTTLMGASGSVGRYLGTRWSTLANARTEWTVAAEAPTRRTTAGLRVVRGERLAWRAWLGADVAVPLSGLGVSAEQVGRVSAGFAVVR